MTRRREQSKIFHFSLIPCFFRSRSKLSTLEEKGTTPKKRKKSPDQICECTMFKLQDLQSTDTWGPSDEWHLEGVLKDVPFAPFSKGDKLGRAADWTSESKDGRDPRNRTGYNRNYRGTPPDPEG